MTPGGRTRLTGLRLEPGRRPVDLAVERFSVFAADSRIVVDGQAAGYERPAPRNVYLRGQVEGEPDSRVLLTFRQKGGMRGVIDRGGERWLLGAGAAARGPLAGVAARRVDPTELAAETSAFECATDSFERASGAPPVTAGAVAAAAEAAASGAPGQIATVAVETDFEYFQLFGNVDDAADYVGDLFAHVSALYEAEADTGFEVGTVFLWTTSADPWTQSSSRCSLYEFGRYWNDNNTGVERSIAHFLSGKNTGGIAWLGTLCLGGFYVDHGGSCPGLTPQLDNYGGDYAFSGGLDGNFDIDNPGVLWDTVVVAHEIGHNFSSRHSHCYGGIGGNTEPVDSCYVGECGGSGCACAPSSLPSGCGGPGEECGTVMSYCHLQSGGFGNVSWTLGAGHAYGDEPDRIASRMAGYALQQAATYPGCLAPGNTAPVAGDDGYSTEEGASLAIGAPGVLGNDTDADGDPLTAELVSTTTNGSLSLAADGSFTYQPAPGFTGTDVFEYRATDGAATSGAATVTLDVAACPGPLDLTLEQQTISDPQSYTACATITAGPALAVDGGGDLTLTAGSTVVLRDGFSLDSGGRLTAGN